MRVLAAVFRREFVERWRALPLAAAIALLTLLAPHAFPGAAAADAREAAMVFAYMAFLLPLAIMVGMSLFARDLAERRASFYFERPIPSLSLAAGKLLAGIAVVLLAAGIALLPSVPLTSTLVGWSATDGLAILPVTVVWAAGLGIIGRSRSSWQLLDFTGLVLFSWTLWRALEPLWLASAMGAAVHVLSVDMTGLGVAMVAAILLAVASGRSSMARAHRAYSLTLWSLTGVTALAVSGYAQWVLTPAPGDLRRAEWVVVSPDGARALATGAARDDYRPTFLLDLDSGAWRRIPTESPSFSGDGRVLAWFAPEGLPVRLDYTLWTLRIDTPSSSPRPTTLVLKDSPPLALDTRGERVAILGEKQVQVYDLAGDKLVAMIPVGPDSGRRLRDMGGIL